MNIFEVFTSTLDKLMDYLLICEYTKLIRYYVIKSKSLDMLVCIIAILVIFSECSSEFILNWLFYFLVVHACFEAKVLSLCLLGFHQ